MAIVIVNQTRGQTLTYKPTSLVLRQSGAAAVMTADFEVIDLASAFTINPEDIVRIQDGGSTAFRGPIRDRSRLDTGLGPSPKRRWMISCQDMTATLGEVVCYGAAAVRPAETDRARIQALVTAFPGVYGLTAPSATVQNLTGATQLPAADYTAMNLYEAFEEIAKLVSGGASFYVDFAEPAQVHWFQTETSAAPFTLSDTPNNTTSFGYRDLEMPDDTFEMVNAVYAVGGAGTTPVWIDDGSRGILNSVAAASIALYGRKEGSYRDPDQTSQATLQSLAAAMIGRLANPRGPWRCKVYRPGLLAGQNVTLVNGLWGVNQSRRISSLNAKPIISDNQLEYEIVMGDSPVTLGGEVTSRESDISAAVGAAGTALANTPDAIAPATPTGLTATSGYDTSIDGTYRPFVDLACTPNTEPDLQAYEFQIDEANRGVVTFAAAVIATGGTMPAGTYSVQVTAIGPSGETRGGTPVQQVTIAAGNRLGVTITAYPNASSYRIFASRASAPLFLQTTTTTGAQVALNAEGTGVPAPTTNTFVDFQTPLLFRSALEKVHVEDLLGGVTYAARVRALDKSNNYSGWTAPVAVVTARDSVAPAIPGGLDTADGFRLIGISWQRVAALDLDRYEVRWAPDLAGVPDTSQWTKYVSRATTLVVTDLDPGIYWFQVRAVDTSNNVQTSAVVTTAVDADANGEAGWSSSVSGTATLVGAADVAFNSVITNIMNTNILNASDVQTGTLTIGGTAATPDYLIIVNALGQEIGRWDTNGLLVKDPTNTSRQMRFLNGTLAFSSNGGTTWTTALNADGITADAIKLGAAPGGHNAIPNASFELSAFATFLSKVWTLAADWATGTSQVNVTVTGADLTLTTVTY